MVVKVPNHALKALQASGDVCLTAPDARTGAIDHGFLAGAEGDASTGEKPLRASDQGHGVTTDDSELVGGGEEHREVAQVDRGRG